MTLSSPVTSSPHLWFIQYSQGRSRGNQHYAMPDPGYWGAGGGGGRSWSSGRGGRGGGSYFADPDDFPRLPGQARRGGLRAPGLTRTLGAEVNGVAALSGLLWPRVGGQVASTVKVIVVGSSHASRIAKGPPAPPAMGMSVDIEHVRVRGGLVGGAKSADVRELRRDHAAPSPPRPRRKAAPAGHRRGVARW